MTWDAVVVADDRGDGETGLKITIASLARFCPAVPVLLFRPRPSPQFGAWLRAYPQVSILNRWPEGVKEWNCKPFLLNEALDYGFERVVWLDSDVLISRPPKPLYSWSDPNTLFATEQPTSLVVGPRSMDRLAAAWSLPLGKSHDAELNSCLVGVTSAHRHLLTRWAELVSSPAYLRFVGTPVNSRPFGFRGDQDVLGALVSSEEFRDVDVRLLRNGIDMIHSGGGLAVPLSRCFLGIFRPVPAVVHAGGGKPWVVMSNEFGRRSAKFFVFYRRLLQEVSPYMAEAERLRDELEEEAPWLGAKTSTGRLLRVTGCGNWALRGLPAWTAARFVRILQSCPSLFLPTADSM
jgi:hypothetical protein